MTLDNYETLEDLLIKNGIKVRGDEPESDSVLSIGIQTIGIEYMFEYEGEDVFVFSRAKANFLIAFLHSRMPVDIPVEFTYWDDNNNEIVVETSQVYIID